MIAKSNNSFFKSDGNAVFKEYLTNNRTLDMCQININGKYPAVGFLKNNRCNIAIYCISGSAKVIIDNVSDNVKRGDVIIINAHSKYCFVGKEFVGAFSSTPMYNLDQREIITDKKNQKK